MSRSRLHSRERQLAQAIAYEEAIAMEREARRKAREADWMRTEIANATNFDELKAAILQYLDSEKGYE